MAKASAEITLSLSVFEAQCLYNLFPHIPLHGTEEAEALGRIEQALCEAGFIFMESNFFVSFDLKKESK